LLDKVAFSLSSSPEEMKDGKQNVSGSCMRVFVDVVVSEMAGMLNRLYEVEVEYAMTSLMLHLCCM